jgi:hypothetical protein
MVMGQQYIFANKVLCLKKLYDGSSLARINHEALRGFSIVDDKDIIVRKDGQECHVQLGWLSK